MKVTEQLENTVGKEEIVCCKQFLLFPHVFKGLLEQTGKNQGLFGKGLRQCPEKVYSVHYRSDRLYILSSLTLIYTVSTTDYI